MATRDDFHPDLYLLLDSVWSRLLALKSYWDIYQLYTRSEGPARAFAPDVLDGFLEQLGRIGQANPERIWIQGSTELGLDHHVELPDDLLWRTFYHFLAPTRADADKRVYVHVADPFDDHWVPLMERLVPMLASEPGFDSVKVAGPANTDRQDQIVAYTRGERAQRAIVTALQDLHEHLQKGTPLCVREVFEGVGIADEPPGVRLVESDPQPPAQSFGTYLAKALWWAVERSREIETHKKGFLEHAKLALEIVGIDPREPHLHPERWRIEALSERGEEARRKRSAHGRALNWASDAAEDWA